MVREREDEALDVLLGDAPVGVLRRNKYDAVEFALLESYKVAQPKPILGQKFLDDPDRVWRVRSRIPEWFSNLLPEGPLRELVAKQAAVSPQREFFLLRHLGQDLPGAVRVVPSQAELALVRDASFSPNPDEASGNEWHFSLAGVQLKFSAREGERGLTIPVSGTGGNWIVKLPDGRYEGVPENEYATMLWAKESGIEVPETRLVALDAIDGLPAHLYQGPGKTAYAIRRFDRGEDGSRIHIEDFAQVLGLFPEEKYKQFNYETIANVLAALAGEEGLKAFIHRLIFVIASGNGDAHHKNWSLIYPDGVNARLAPAYDLVSTIQYMPDDRLALTLARSRAWSDVSFQSFTRLARKIGSAESTMKSMVEESAGKVLDAWSRVRAHVGYEQAAVDRLDRHMREIPLLRISR